MGRGFYWEDHGTDDGIDHAVLYGPEPYMVAAVVTMDYGDPYLQESFWRVMSSAYCGLNFAEENTALPIEDIKRRVGMFLVNELRGRSMELNADMESAMALLFDEKRKEKG